MLWGWVLVFLIVYYCVHVLQRHAKTICIVACKLILASLVTATLYVAVYVHEHMDQLTARVEQYASEL